MKTINRVNDLLGYKAWKQTDEELKESLNKSMKEQGDFEYSDEGFQIKISSESITVNWADVREITAYKVDLLTVDEIRIDVVAHASTITITEDTPGYNVFKEKLKSIFPDSDKNWEEKVVKPAFAENLTVIYKK